VSEGKGEIVKDEIIYERVAKNEWSSRHVRLKFQMIISCLLAGGCLAYGVENVIILKIVELRDQPSENVTIFAFVSYAIFSIFAFLSRTSFEFRDIGPNDRVFALELANLKEDLKTLVPFLESMKSNLLVNTVNGLEIREQTSELKLREKESIKRLVDEYNKLIYNADLTLLRINSSSKFLTKEVFKFHSLNFLRLECLAAINSLRTSLPLLGRYVEQIRKVIVDPSPINYSTVKTSARYLENNEIQTLSDLDRATKSVNELQTSISGLNFWRKIENWLFSIFLPVATALALLVFGCISHILSNRASI